MNSFSDTWNEICFLLSENVKPSFSEKDFENQVVRALEVLGWREFKGEIVRQPTIQLGRENTLRPDLVVNHENLPLIVLEVKRPIEDITKDNTIGQLSSYMRQMKSEIGFLVGSELRLYYDGASNPQPTPLLIEKISFKRNLPEGEMFVRNFNKNSFLNREYTLYLADKINKFSKQRQITKLAELLISEDTKQKIIGFLRREFVDYGDEIFSEAIFKITVEVKKREEIVLAQKPKEVSHPKKMRQFAPISTRTKSNHFEERQLGSRGYEQVEDYIIPVIRLLRSGKEHTEVFHEIAKKLDVRYQTVSAQCTRQLKLTTIEFLEHVENGRIFYFLEARYPGKIEILRKELGNFYNK
ncbi:type I restriction endonuclease [Candidatus Omnitrophota bacterium]